MKRYKKKKRQIVIRGYSEPRRYEGWYGLTMGVIKILSLPPEGEHLSDYKGFIFKIEFRLPKICFSKGF